MSSVSPAAGRLVCALAAAMVVVAAPARAETLEGTERSALRTIEGRVVALEEQPGEGELAVVTATLLSDSENGDSLMVQLAPASVLDETGFDVAEGDRLRLRIFLAGEGPARAQKVRNLTRQTMLRLRTLHQIPLWDGGGHWRGGPGPGGPMHGGRSPGGHRGPPR